MAVDEHLTALEFLVSYLFADFLRRRYPDTVDRTRYAKTLTSVFAQSVRSRPGLSRDQQENAILVLEQKIQQALEVSFVWDAA